MVQCTSCNEWTDSYMYWTHDPSKGVCRTCYNRDSRPIGDWGKALRDSDPVSSPSHYTSGSIETIDVIEDWKLGYHLGNAVKYISRSGKKDPLKTVEDLKKAIWYLERKIKNEEKKNG